MSYRDSTLEGQELSDREAAMLADADAGMTDKQLAEKYGYASANGAGNVRRIALTKVGRGNAVRAGGGGRSSTPKARDPFEVQIQQTIDRTREEIERLQTTLSDAQAVQDQTPKQIIAAEQTRLQEAVDKAQAALTAFGEQDKAANDQFVAKVREQAKTRLESLETSTTEAIERSQTELQKMELALAALSS